MIKLKILGWRENPDDPCEPSAITRVLIRGGQKRKSQRNNNSRNRSWSDGAMRAGNAGGL